MTCVASTVLIFLAALKVNFLIATEESERNTVLPKVGQQQTDGTADDMLSIWPAAPDNKDSSRIASEQNERAVAQDKPAPDSPVPDLWKAQNPGQQLPEQFGRPVHNNTAGLSDTSQGIHDDLFPINVAVSTTFNAKESPEGEPAVGEDGIQWDVRPSETVEVTNNEDKNGTFNGQAPAETLPITSNLGTSGDDEALKSIWAPIPSNDDQADITDTAQSFAETLARDNGIGTGGNSLQDNTLQSIWNQPLKTNGKTSGTKTDQSLAETSPSENPKGTSNIGLPGKLLNDEPDSAVNNQVHIEPVTASELALGTADNGEAINTENSRVEGERAADDEAPAGDESIDTVEDDKVPDKTDTIKDGTNADKNDSGMDYKVARGTDTVEEDEVADKSVTVEDDKVEDKTDLVTYDEVADKTDAREEDKVADETDTVEDDEVTDITDTVEDGKKTDNFELARNTELSEPPSDDDVSSEKVENIEGTVKQALDGKVVDERPKEAEYDPEDNFPSTVRQGQEASMLGNELPSAPILEEGINIGLTTQLWDTWKDASQDMEQKAALHEDSDYDGAETDNADYNDYNYRNDGDYDEDADNSAYESSQDNYDEEENEEFWKQFEDDYGQEYEEKLETEASKDMLESPHHFDSHLGSLAGSKVYNGQVKKGVVPLQPSSLMDSSLYKRARQDRNMVSFYSWMFFVCLLFTLGALGYWNRALVTNYIFRSGSGPESASSSRKSTSMMEEGKDFLKNEYA